MKEFNKFQNENFEKDVIIVEQTKHEVEERPRAERSKHEVEERPRVERPKHEVEERPRVERPKHEVEERPRSVEGKINYIINFNVDKTQLLELKKYWLN